MNLLEFQGHLIFMGQRYPVQFQIDIGVAPAPGGGGDGVFHVDDAYDDDAYDFDRADIDSGQPVEIRPHPGRRINRKMIESANTDEQKESLLSARFPWLADCWKAEPASVQGPAITVDPLAADLDRLTEIAESDPDQLLKPDGSVNKSAVARALDLPTGGTAWERVTRLADRLKEMVA